MWIHKFMIASRIKYILKNVLCNFSSYSCPPKIAVVGGGPAGFYCTQRLLKVSGLILNFIIILLQKYMICSNEIFYSYFFYDYICIS